MMTGYKGTHNYQCLNQTYEVGKEYKIDVKPIVCSRGFHYCKDAKDVLWYYPYYSTFKLLEIEDLNPNETMHKDDKSCSNHIRIIREITAPDELFELLEEYYLYDQKGNALFHKSIYGWEESTFDEQGNELTYKDNKGYSFEATYDEYSNQLTFKNSEGLFLTHN